MKTRDRFKRVGGWRLDALLFALAMLTIALPVGFVYGAANRAIPLTGPLTMGQVATDLNEELVELYKNAPATLGSVAGTNTITASVTPALVGYLTGQSFWLTAAATNTTTVTININSLGAKAIRNSLGAVLPAGDIVIGNTYLIYYDGTNFRIVAGGSAGGLRNLYFDAGQMVSETTTGCAAGSTETTTNQVMYATWDCDAATKEGVQFKFIPPKGTLESTIFSMSAHWTAASGSGAVVWVFSCLARSDGDAIDTAFGTEIAVADTMTGAGAIQQTGESLAITPSGTWAEGDMLFCRVQRDAAAGGDTLGVDAKLLGVKVTLSMISNTDN